MFTPTQLAEMAKPLSSTHVKERTQAGRALSYIEGWHAIAEANRIFGFDGWTRETVSLTRVAETPRKIGKTNSRDGWSVSYLAHVRVTVWAGDRVVTREGSGAGHGIDVDLGLAHESAAKEAETDAMKRALMTFGNPFGLALYDKDRTSVETPRSAALSAALDAAKAKATKEDLRALVASSRAALNADEYATLVAECKTLAANINTHKEAAE